MGRDANVETLDRKSVFVVHAAVFLVLMWWSWRKWPDPIVDFGRELYVPWQLTQGKLLYRDIASLFGPLSPYVNAFWMRVFGVSLITIAMCNAAIFAATLGCIHAFIRTATDRLTATAASLAVLVLCGFGQYVEFSNYNFITPYAHEATHGLALGIVIIMLMHRALARSRPSLAALAGICFGLLLLTKPEVPIAVGVAVGAGVFGYMTIGARERRTAGATTVALCAGSLAAPAMFYAYFRTQTDHAQAVRSIASGWLSASNPAILANQFYAGSMGFDEPLRNTALMLLLFLGILAWIAAVVAVSWRPSPPRSRNSELKHLGLILILVSVPIAQSLPLGRTLPLVGIAALVATAAQFWIHRRNHESAMRCLALVMWCAFAVVILAKIFLNARISHYGAYLSLPAITVAVISLCSLIPNLLERWRRGPAAREFRWVAAVAVAVATLPHLANTQRWFATKQLSIGSGGDRFYVCDSPRCFGVLARDALQTVAQEAKVGDTMAVVPEGVMLNYLSRLPSPLRVVTLMPPEMMTFGEEAVVHSLEASPPTFVVFVHKGAVEYGYPLFGTNARYGLQIMSWVTARYRSRHIFGMDPRTQAGYGIEIFERATDDVRVVH